MKAKIHLATKEFCFIELEVEGTIVDAVKAHRYLASLLELSGDDLNQTKSGLSVKEYADVRRKLLMTNEFDVNLEEEMNHEQLRWVKSTNNTLRSIKDEEDGHN